MDTDLLHYSIPVSDRYMVRDIPKVIESRNNVPHFFLRERLRDLTTFI